MAAKKPEKRKEPAKQKKARDLDIGKAKTSEMAVKQVSGGSGVVRSAEISPKGYPPPKGSTTGMLILDKE